MMNSRYFLLLALTVTLVALPACERLLDPPRPETDPVSIFDEAWGFVDREYSFFTYKNIDWDSVYNVYRPRVDANTNEIELFYTLDSMLFTLRDGHVNLRSFFDRTRNWHWYLNSPPNFNFDVLERNYFRERQEFVGPFIARDFGDVGYIYYNSFGSFVSNTSIDWTTIRFQRRKGLIIDIRDNGGGSLSNALRIASRFVESQTEFGRQRVKNGPGHDDFTDLETLFIEPEEPENDEDTVYRYLKPVVLLTNANSYSAANYFTLMMKSLPRVRVFGDTTGGGGGAPANTELANGWNLRVSATQLFDLDGFNVEDGIPPDTVITMTPENVAAGVDPILEAAVLYLRDL